MRPTIYLRVAFYYCIYNKYYLLNSLFFANKFPCKISSSNHGIALGSWGGGIIVSEMGLMHTPGIGALIVLVALALTRMSGRLDKGTAVHLSEANLP
jgi:hypothetical protein